jgi:hypothetical protein
MEQGETIREFLARRDRWIRAWRIAGAVLLLILFPFLVWARGQQHLYLRLGAFIAFCGFLGALVYLTVTTRCPRCGFDLRSKPATAHWLKIAKDHCPQCGVSLDESLKLG